MRNVIPAMQLYLLPVMQCNVRNAIPVAQCNVRNAIIMLFLLVMCSLLPILAIK